MKAAPFLAGLAGSSPRHVLDDAMTATHAVYLAEQALGNTAPNGRDYIGRPDDLQEATDRYRRQLRDLQAIQRELAELAEVAADAQAEREARGQ